METRTIGNTVAKTEFKKADSFLNILVEIKTKAGDWIEFELKGTPLYSENKGIEGGLVNKGKADMTQRVRVKTANVRPAKKETPEENVEF